LRQEGRAHRGAAFLIEGNQCFLADHFAQIGGKLAHLVFCSEVAAEQTYRANVMLVQNSACAESSKVP
jgi:hypothetical protein